MMMYLLFLFILLCNNIINGTTFTPRVEYISYISSSTGSFPINYGNGGTTTKFFPSLMKADDSPFEEFQLPFAFPFFGSNIYRIFISPNGAIHTEPSQPCVTCNCFAAQTDCTLNSSYYRSSNTSPYVKTGYSSIIAGILYDLLPANSTTNGNISVTNSTIAVTITFDKIKVFGSGIHYTFNITLFEDGSVIINYGSMTKYPPLGQWASGMRGPRSSSYTSSMFKFPYANLTSSQISKKSVWSTNYYGIYPNTISVGEKYFVVCPLSMTWTATTVNVDLTNYDTINFKPISISCSSIFQVSSSLRIGIYLQSDPTKIQNCTYIDASKWFNCKLSTILGSSPTAGDYNVHFVWSEPIHSSSWSPMNANPIKFTFGAALDSNICAINDYIASCNACNIYNNNNFTCLNLPCTKLYDHPDCNGDCMTTSITDSSYHFNDIYGTCCALADIDCSGVCDGELSLGYEKILFYPLNITKCCNADCNSQCEGKSQSDACGTCEGQDYSGKGCSTHVTIDTGYGPNSLYANISALEPNKPLKSLVTINNTNNTYINVKFKVSGSSFLGPRIIYPKETTRINGNSNKTFLLNTSLDTMIYGDINGWEVKTVYVSYTRPSFSKFEYSYLINVYPNTDNCSAVTNRNTCMRLPGCIFCYTYPAIRVLSEVDSETSAIKESLLRRLFTNIMAEQAGVRTYSLSAGTCTQGWNTNDCPIKSAGYRTSSYNLLIFILSSFISILILL